MNVVKNVAAGAVLGGSLLFTAGLVIANAQPEEPPSETDGLVTVLIGGSTAQDGVPAEVAAATVTEACGGDPAAVTALAQQVDVDGAGQTVCQDVLIIQNSSETVQAPGDSAVETEAPAIPGGEAPAAPAEGTPVPAVPGEGESDVPFNTGG